MKKKVLIVTFLIVTIVVCSLIVLLLLNNQGDANISLLQESITIEYGKTYNPTLDKLIDLAKFNNIDAQKIIIESNILNEDNKEYPPVGEYEIIISYKNRALVQKVEIKDTISPELSIQESITIPNGTDLGTYNFKDLLTINDLSELKDYNIDFSTVNSSIAGEYIAKVTVEDIYSNKAEKEFKIIIPDVKNENNEVNSTVTKKSSNTKTTENSTKANNNTTSTNGNNNIQENTDKKQESNTPPSNVPSNPPKEDIVKPKPERCTNNNNHFIGIGNSGKWFSTKNEAIDYYKSKLSYWGKQWENDQIDDNTYYQNCPSGYEIWSCAYCSKWTINFYYR